MYDSSSLPLLPQHHQAVSVGGDVMPSMAYLLLPFKCLVFNLYFNFFFVLTIERDMARANMNTKMYTDTHRKEEDNEICVDNLFNDFLLIDSFSFTKLPSINIFVHM